MLASTGMFEPAVLVETVLLRSTLTVADRLGAAPEYAMTIAGLVALLLWSRRPLRKATDIEGSIRVTYDGKTGMAEACAAVGGDPCLRQTVRKEWGDLLD